MSRIRIKNFGPIKEGLKENDGWIDINKFTVFIGNQGSGKSTVAKLISTFVWIEKALTRGDSNRRHFTANKFRLTYCGYHNIQNYFHNGENDSSEIEYMGNSFNIVFKDNKLTIKENKKPFEQYLLPQILYVPSERSVLNYVRLPTFVRFKLGSILDFATELENALNDVVITLPIPINNSSLEYDPYRKIVKVIGKDYIVKLKEASSGFQSAIPLFMVSRYLANKISKNEESIKESMSAEELKRFIQGVKDIWDNINFTNEQRRAALSVLASKFNNSVFINIVEEPEQNLFPSSQKELLFSLIEFANMSIGNKLIMTTHSPYLINYLTLAVKANAVHDKINSNLKNAELLSKINKIVPQKSIIKSNDLTIYELNESGSISKLKKYEGLPSDENYLNRKLEEDNELFLNLLEIEEKCQ
jgi:predicted ATPase